MSTFQAIMFGIFLGWSPAIALGVTLLVFEGIRERKLRKERVTAIDKLLVEAALYELGNTEWVE